MITEANNFFNEHPLKKDFFEFDEELRNSAIKTACRDVTAALHLDTTPESPSMMFKAAVFEQAVYLLLNPHILAGSTDSSGKAVLAPRARALLDRLSGTICGSCSISRG